jgi:hypothetical protein
VRGARFDSAGATNHIEGVSQDDRVECEKCKVAASIVVPDKLGECKLCGEQFDLEDRSLYRRAERRADTASAAGGIAELVVDVICELLD